jgi:hypothetical protein
VGRHQYRDFWGQPLKWADANTFFGGRGLVKILDELGGSTHPLFLLYPADKSQPGLDLVRSRRSGLGSNRCPSCCYGSPSRGCSPLPHTRSFGQDTWLCVCAEPSLAQGAGDRPDERRGGLYSALSPLPGPVQPSGWCRQGNSMTWGRLSRCSDSFHGTVMTSTTRQRPP